MALINVSNLTFSYDGSYDYIYNDVSFQIDTDWKLGFVGRNGRGKTTFLNLLMGKYEYSGSIKTNACFEYFPYVVEDKTQNTIDIIEALNSEAQLWQIQRELSLLEVSDDVLYRPFNTLSNGEQSKVLLATLFLKENGFLLIDEPTNHLDYDGRQVVADYLSSKSGFILVSHDRSFLDKSVNHILSINKTNIEVQKGNFSSWYKNKELEDGFETAQNEKLKKEINRLALSAQKAAGWSDKVEKSKYGGDCPDRGFAGHKSAKMMKRSKVIQARREEGLEEKSKLLKNIENYEDLKLNPLKFHSDNLLSIEKLSISYDDKLICQGFNLNVQQGERIALRGKNGCGKSSILKLICGENIKHEGDIQKPQSLKISYVSQDTSHLHGDLSSFVHQYKIDETLFKTILRKLDFSREQFEKNIEDYSAGQKKKVLIAKSLCENAHLYIWDEPLNFIDVFSRIQIERLLLSCKSTVLFVEHDKIFAQNVATKIINM